jgi:hypothetical protein
MRFPLVVVEWVDAYSTDPWTPVWEFDDEEKACRSVGYLVKKGKKHLHVAGTFSESGDDAACTMSIPRGMVKRITYIKKGKR